jgi:hypothetical protein
LLDGFFFWMRAAKSAHTPFADILRAVDLRGKSGGFSGALYFVGIQAF